MKFFFENIKKFRFHNFLCFFLKKKAFCDWEYISKFFPDYTGIKLKLKWFSFQKSKAQKDLWIKEEELLLAEIIQFIIKIFIIHY